MKVLDPSLQSALAAESTTIAWCWLIERLDGVKLGFTSFDLPLIIDGITYSPQTGFSPSAQDNQEGVERNNSQSLQGILSSEEINEADLAAGKYEYAAVHCFLVDVTSLPANLSLDPPKHLSLYNGTVGKISKNDRTYNLEARSLDAFLEAKLGELTSKFCRNNFGDFRCGVNLSPHTFTRSIVSVVNSYTFEIDGSHIDGEFDRGLFTHNSISRDIATFSDGIVTLFQPFPLLLGIGNTVTLVRGCQKTLLACAKYGGINGNQSEPHVPLQDDALNTPISEA